MAASGGIFCTCSVWILRFVASYQQLFIQLPGRENLSGSGKYRHSFLLLQFHFHRWKCYECRKRSWASPPLKMHSTRLIALPKEICRRARNRTRISWQPALCLSSRPSSFSKARSRTGWMREGKALFNSVSETNTWVLAVSVNSGLGISVSLVCV